MTKAKVLTEHDIDKITKLVKSIEETSKCQNVKLFGNKHNFDVLKQAGLLENYDYIVMPEIEDDKILVMPYNPEKHIKIIYE